MIPSLNTLLCLMAMRCGPQRLSADNRQLVPALGLHVAIGAVLGLADADIGYALLSALLTTLVMVAVVHAALSLNDRGNRVVQSLVALAWCEILLGLLALPIILFELELAPLLLLSLLVIGWNLAIAANIFRHALELEKGAAFLYALGYFFVAMLVLGMMPEAATAIDTGAS